MTYCNRCGNHISDHVDGCPPVLKTAEEDECFCTCDQCGCCGVGVNRNCRFHPYDSGTDDARDREEH